MGHGVSSRISGESWRQRSCSRLGEKALHLPAEASMVFAMSKSLCFCVGYLVAGPGLVPVAKAEEGVLISEFMAQNVSGLQDDHGEASDWIEIYNSGEREQSLAGWFLTDSEDDLTKWKFPEVSLAPQTRLVVFASGRDQRDVPEPQEIRERNRRRLRDVGLPEQFLDRVPADQLERFLQQMERQRGRGNGGLAEGEPLPSLHAGFKLSAEGEYLALVKADGKTVIHAFDPKYPEQHEDVSYGWVEAETGQEKKIDYLLEATPGWDNAEALRGLVEPVAFSHPAGLVEEALALELRTSPADAEIRYTLDGAVPGSDAGEVYREPLTITGTTVVRAAAFKRGHRASTVETRSYLFLDDVLTQSPSGQAPPGWPASVVNDQWLDYGMDPDIVGDGYSPAEMKAALLELPALSLVAPLPSLFDRREGIYVNARQRGREWEREASLELLPLSREEPGFQVNGGLRIRGGFSRQGSNPKHGVRMIFRKEYGDGKLRYPLFGDEGAEVFDKIDLRSSMNYSWAMGGGLANTLLRDVFSRDTQRDMAQPYTRSRFYHLYLNGHYWGIYMTQERAEASYGETYFGGDKEDYDTIKTFGEVVDGTGDARGRLYREALAGFASDARYFRVQGMNPDGRWNPEFERLVDVDNLIDYMLITFYTGDKDGPGGTFGTGNNYYSLYNRENPDGFKYFEHDSEHSLGLGVDDITGSFVDDGRGDLIGRYGERQFNAHWLHTRLVESPHYLARFTERVEKHFFNGGALTEEACLARLEAREKEIERAILAHAARWGDAQRESPMTPADWRAGVEDIKEFMVNREDVVLRQLHRRGWYQGIPSPVFNRAAGVVSAGTPLHVSESLGEVYVTRDGTDPRGEDGAPVAGSVRMRLPCVERVPLLASPSLVRVTVPRDGSLGLEWTRPEFDDGAWLLGRTGVGYEAKFGYEPLIGVDLLREMHGQATTAYLRCAFSPKTTGPAFDELRMRMRYDDGFVAYLNGKRALSVNAPENPRWNSEATKDHADDVAVDFVEFPLDAGWELLDGGGTNVLAVHGMDGPASSDFLITPELHGIRYGGAGPLVLGEPGEVLLGVRSLHQGKWSPLTEWRFEVK